MNSLFLTIHTQSKKLLKKKGFVLPFTMLISSLVLFIVTGAMTRLSKQFYFSNMQKQSEDAYRAADDAMSCATSIDDTFVGSDGLGMFPSSQVVDPQVYVDGVLSYVNDQRSVNDLGLSPISSISAITCAGVPIFNQSISSINYDGVYTYYTTVNGSPVSENGKITTFTMKMGSGSHSPMCAKVTIKKTASFRQIISQGYSVNDCSSNVNAIERAVVSTVVTE